MECVVLVVEDDPIVRLGAIEIVEGLGCMAFEAQNADEAVRVLEAHPEITLLFTDIDMPGTMDGLELAEVVHSRWPDKRLIVTSGHAVIPNENLPDDGKFVTKPYYPGAVRAAIRQSIDHCAS
ncbi:response regulator [Hansschlegelia zhihuaiae]|uniref:Response regulator n=1 Tax=Hansschlegelia zhihuaiae TaxID=405005 RepID=A0A4Q0M7Z0_9HYPH|nr:response regulator [Hansschlegelia zhihuaiae]RXF69221.1 response regulator [Hansschlegelia zhihuaiae]